MENQLRTYSNKYITKSAQKLLNRKKHADEDEELDPGDQVMVMESLGKSKKKNFGRGLYKYLGDVAFVSDCKKYYRIHWGYQGVHPPNQKFRQNSTKQYRRDQLRLVKGNEAADLLLQSFLVADRLDHILFVVTILE